MSSTIWALISQFCSTKPLPHEGWPTARAGPVSRLGSFEPGDKTGLRLSPQLSTYNMTCTCTCTCAVVDVALSANPGLTCKRGSHTMLT